MKRKLERQAATGDLRAAKGFARARKTVYHATTEEIVRCKKACKETETASMIIMDVAVNRVFGWGKKNALRMRKKMHTHMECIKSFKIMIRARRSTVSDLVKRSHHHV